MSSKRHITGIKGCIICHPWWKNRYFHHIIDNKGYVVQSSVKKPLSWHGCLIGHHIEDVFYPGDCRKFQGAMEAAQTGQSQFTVYTINTTQMLALVEYIPQHNEFSIHEVELQDRTDLWRLQRLLLIKSGGLYTKFFNKEIG